MTRLLGEAALLGNATARAITYQPRISGVFIYPDTDSAWTTAYANKNTTFETGLQPVFNTTAITLQKTLKSLDYDSYTVPSYTMSP